MTKMVALKDEAYEILAGFKRKGESFSDVVFRLGDLLKAKRKKSSLLEFAGTFTWEEGEQLLEAMRESRAMDKQNEHDWKL